MSSPATNIFAVDDSELYDKVQARIAEKRPFILRDGRQAKHRAATLREVRGLMGFKDDHSIWCKTLDAMRTHRVILVWGMAIEKAHFTWVYQEFPERVDIIFTPPEAG